MPKKWENSTKSRVYTAWRNMRRRCNDPKDDSYKYYGGRGIRVCDEWYMNFDRFVLDMGHPPEGMTLDRVDPNKNYEKSNCRWIPAVDQFYNRRDNHYIEHEGRKMTVTEWASVLNVKPDTLFKRLKRMPSNKALTYSLKKTWRHGTRTGYENRGCRCDDCRSAHAKRFRERRAYCKMYNTPENT